MTSLLARHYRVWQDERLLPGRVVITPDDVVLLDGETADSLHWTEVDLREFCAAQRPPYRLEDQP